VRWTLCFFWCFSFSSEISWHDTQNVAYSVRTWRANPKDHRSLLFGSPIYSFEPCSIYLKFTCSKVYPKWKVRRRALNYKKTLYAVLLPRNPISSLNLYAQVTRIIYHPTALRRVQISPKTSTNITRYLYFRGPVRQVFSRRGSDKLDWSYQKMADNLNYFSDDEESEWLVNIDRSL